MIRDQIFGEVKAEISMFNEKYNAVPGIAFVGFNCVPLSKYNIPMHIQMAMNVGLRVSKEILQNNATEQEVFDVIDRLNSDSGVDAIVLLQPLPDHLNPVRIVNRISPIKEVEGFHPQNMINTMIPDLGTARYPMCLPAALYEMFKEAELKIEAGKEWVFVLDDGFFSNSLTKMIVRSAASVVVPNDSPVTFINKDSTHLIDHVKRADFLVVVTKFSEYIQSEWIKEGACIIDIYSNLLKEIPSKTDPSKLVPVIRGGINVASVTGIAGALLPIPGGLMTVVLAILFRNTVTAFKNSLKLVNPSVRSAA